MYVYRSDLRADERLSDPSHPFTDLLQEQHNPKWNVLGALYEAVVEKKFDGDRTTLYALANQAGPLPERFRCQQAYVSQDELIERTNLTEEELYGDDGVVPTLIDDGLIVNGSYVSPSTNTKSDGTNRFGFRRHRFNHVPGSTMAQLEMMVTGFDEDTLAAYEFIESVENAESVMWVEELGVSKTYVSDVFDWGDADHTLASSTVKDLFSRSRRISPDDERLVNHVETFFEYEPDAYKDKRRERMADVYYQKRDSTYSRMLDTFKAHQ